MNPASALLVLSTGFLVTGCASMGGRDAPQVTATFNEFAPKRESKTYTIRCETAAVSRWFTSAPPALIALGQALEKQGYVEAEGGAPATHLLKVDLGFGPRRAAPRLEAENPDSVRYQNVAAIAPGGRYNQVLTERDDATGTFLVGPNGEEVPTGAWKKIVAENRRVSEHPAESYDVLLISAWDIAPPSPGAGEFVWQIVVKLPVDYTPPTPKQVGRLLEQASTRVNAGLHRTPEPPRKVAPVAP